MDLQITEKLLSDQRVVLTLNGRLNAVTAPDLKAQLKRLAKGGHVQLVIDLTDVPFIDSSGLAALVSGLKAIREAGGTLKLAGLNEQARTVLTLTMLDRVFEMYPDAEAALEALPAA
ncbi:MAG: anti-sigma factor antagonist [Anaerolineales bacterium]|nr:MAG: anti-sigma factor antagonist [Anaerolineales bacterium]